MIIDCDACAMQHTVLCDDCVVTFILEDLPGTLELAPPELEAMATLAEAGLVPPLRLLPRKEPPQQRAG